MSRFLYSLLFLSILSCQKGGETPNTTTATTPDSTQAPADILQLSTDQIRLAEVQLGRVEYRNLSQTLTVNGRVVASPQNRVTLSALQGGFVRQINLLPGQSVRQGQVVARVENPDLIQIQQEYAENRARLTYLESEFARQQELSRENVGALKVFQQTASELNATRARLGALTQRLRRVGLSPEAAVKGQFSSTYAVVSPISGVITDVPANLGQYVQPTDVIAQLTGTNNLLAELTVFEKDLASLREGQRMRVQLANERGRERFARVYLINRTVEADRSVKILARFEASQGAGLLPNTFLKAILELGDSRTTAVPEGAIVTSEGKDYIFVQQASEKGGIPFKAVPVRRGITQNGYSAVVLPESFDIGKSSVVIKGAYALLSQWLGAGAEEE